MAEKLNAGDLLILKTIHAHGVEKWLYTNELARLAKVSASSTSTGCRRLAKQGVLLYKEEGREKSYRLNLSNPRTRKLCEFFETEKREKLYDKHRRLSWELEEFTKRIFEVLPQVQSIILFGSVARGQWTKASDIDLLLLVPTLAQDNFNELMNGVNKVAAEVRARYGSPLAPIPMTLNDFEVALRERKRIAQDVIREGIVLFGEERYYRVLAKVIV
ncbi:MAG: nucleotidyltransferase domain-containing protein [Candidatus Bathyarchaeia archaeon]